MTRYQKYANKTNLSSPIVSVRSSSTRAAVWNASSRRRFFFFFYQSVLPALRVVRVRRRKRARRGLGLWNRPLSRDEANDVEQTKSRALIKIVRMIVRTLRALLHRPQPPLDTAVVVIRRKRSVRRRRYYYNSRRGAQYNRIEYHNVKRARRYYNYGRATTARRRRRRRTRV